MDFVEYIAHQAAPFLIKTNTMKEAEFQETNPTQDLSFYISAFKNRWWLFSVTGLTCTCLAYVFALSQTPVYESKIRLIRDATVELPGGSPENISGRLSGVTDRAGAADEIIKSRSVLKKALLSQTMFADRDMKFIYQNTSAAMDKVNPILTVTYRDSSPRRVQAFLDSLAQAFIDNDLESRRASASQAVKYLKATLPQARASLIVAQQQYQNFLRKNGDVAPSKLQESLSINSLSIDKELQTQELNLKAQTGTRGRLIGRLGVGEDEALATAALSSDENYQKSISILQTAYNQLATKRTVLQDQHPEIVGLKKQIAATEGRLREQAGDILSDKLFRKARTESGLPAAQLDSMIDMEVKAKTTGTALNLAMPNPVRSTLTTELVEAETKIAASTASSRALQQAKQAVRGRMNGLAEKVVQEANYANEVERSLKVLNSLTERMEYYRLAVAQQVTPWSVLEQAEPPDFPIAPKPLNNALFGLAIGSVLGFLLAYYLELANNRLRLKEDFQRILGVPLLGTVPYSYISISSFGTNDGNASIEEDERTAKRGGNFFSNLFSRGKGGPARRRPDSAYEGAVERLRIRESFRRIASRLLFSKPDEDLRTICVTSCVPAEGKSTCSFNLAHALSELGKQVLLIDADMRRPTIHHLAEISNHAGLSTVLTNSSMQAMQAVRRDLGRVNFDIMTAGPVAPNPVALLSTKRFNNIVSELKREYDIVIIDTPPSVTFADSQVIASAIDSVLFVVSRGALRAQMLVDVKNNFSQNVDKFVGFVINSTSEGKTEDDTFDAGYYYYYHQSEDAAARDLVADEE